MNTLKKPKLFIGSSSEALSVAQNLQALLQNDCDATVWDQDIFRLGNGILGTLIEQTKVNDLAVLVFSPDDKLYKRGKRYQVARDNVLFELGLFMGSKGLSRTYVVHPNEPELGLPTDLYGIVTASYDMIRYSQNAKAALGPVALKIKEAIKHLSFQDYSGGMKLLQHMVKIYPNGADIALLDLALFYEMINHEQYKILHDALANKII